MLKSWEQLPDKIRNDEVRPYWDSLNNKSGQLFVKRFFDFVIALILLMFLAIPMLVIALMIKIEDGGPVFFRQERVAAYDKVFRIHKFRTMVVDAEKIGASVTVGEDRRITKTGKKLRKLRLDELPQLLDVIAGNMSFVGTRPEVPKYVNSYLDEWYATLLLPPGITSECSISFKDEDEILKNSEDVDRTYIEKVLPEKMRINLYNLRNFSVFTDLKTMVHTVYAIFLKGKVDE